MDTDADVEAVRAKHAEGIEDDYRLTGLFDQVTTMLRAFDLESARRQTAERGAAALRGALEAIEKRATDTSNPLTAPMGNRLQSMMALAQNALADVDAGHAYMPVADAKRVLDASLETCEQLRAEVKRLTEKARGRRL